MFFFFFCHHESNLSEQCIEREIQMSGLSCLLPTTYHLLFKALELAGPLTWRVSPHGSDTGGGPDCPAGAGRGQPGDPISSQ